MQLKIKTIGAILDQRNKLKLEQIIETLGEKKKVKLPMIVPAYTIAQPKTMVVKSLDTSAAFAAVFCAVFADLLAVSTEMLFRLY